MTTYRLHRSSAVRGVCDQCREQRAVMFTYLLLTQDADGDGRQHPSLQFCSEACAEHHATVAALIKNT